MIEAHGQSQLRFDRLLAMPYGTVIDSIPAAERDKYYLRGAAVGALAMNLARGLNRINPQDDLYMHVTQPHEVGSYSEALNHAETLARGPSFGHFDIGEAQELRRLGGNETGEAPGIVLGIPLDKYKLVQHPLTLQPVIGEAVPFSDLDPYSQERLSSVLGVDVANLPDLSALVGPRNPHSGWPVDVI